jgi:hypothetical protein
MRTFYARLILFAVLSFLLTGKVCLADTLDINKSKLYFDNLPETNFWMRSSNPAGYALLENLKRINLVEVGYTFTKKELKFPAEPGLMNSFRADTRGLGRIGKLTFSGSFGYLNEHYNDLLYNNTLNFDPDNPYILGDTVGGKQQKEGFILKGMVAYPLSGRIKIGLDINYQNYVGAKMKDPRNKNDISSLVITPGFVLKAGNFSFGLSGSPVITNNDISVSVTEDAKHSLMQFLGFGYYKPILNIYTYSNTYYGKGYNADAQINFSKGNYSNFLIISYKKLKEEVRYGSSNRLTDGISNKNALSVSDIQDFKNNNNLHRLNIKFNLTQINGTEVMQHFESIIVGSYHYDTLIVDKWTEGRHIFTNYDGALDYSWTRYRGGLEKYRMNTGISGEFMTTYHYPVLTNGFQEVMNIIPYAGFRTFIKTGAITLVPQISAKYRMNLYKDKQFVVTKWSLPEFQQLDYIARHSDFIQGEASFSFIKKTKIRNIPEYFIDLNAVYNYFPDGVTRPAQNIFINTSVGLIF